MTQRCAEKRAGSKKTRSMNEAAGLVNAGAQWHLVRLAVVYVRRKRVDPLLRDPSVLGLIKRQFYDFCSK